jgi:hypothetical protein
MRGIPLYTIRICENVGHNYRSEKLYKGVAFHFKHFRTIQLLEQMRGLSLT